MSKQRTLSSLFVAITVAVAGCSTTTVKTYPGTKLPPNEVSVLAADQSASPGGVAVVIRRVNGVDVVRKKSPEIEVLPGTQVVQVQVLRDGTSNDGYAEARSFTTISFDTIPGKRYLVRGIFENGLGKVWVVGDDDTPVASQPRRAPEDVR